MDLTYFGAIASRNMLSFLHNTRRLLRVVDQEIELYECVKSARERDMIAMPSKVTG